jgi:DNA-binding response OmpR family regulator
MGAHGIDRGDSRTERLDAGTDPTPRPAFATGTLAVAESPATPPASGSPRVPVILLVDDDEYVRHAVRSILRRMSVRIVEASTAAEAIERWDSDAPVLALVDLGLPDGDGLDLVRDLRARSGDRLGIVVLTGQVPGEQEVRDAGADGLVLKPFRLGELREVVQTQVAAHSGRVPEERVAP